MASSPPPRRACRVVSSSSARPPEAPGSSYPACLGFGPHEALHGDFTSRLLSPSHHSLLAHRPQSGHSQQPPKSQKFETRKSLMILRVTSCKCLTLPAKPEGQGPTKVTQDLTTGEVLLGQRTHGSESPGQTLLPPPPAFRPKYPKVRKPALVSAFSSPQHGAGHTEHRQPLQPLLGILPWMTGQCFSFPRHQPQPRPCPPLQSRTLTRWCPRRASLVQPPGERILSTGRAGQAGPGRTGQGGHLSR